MYITVTTKDGRKYLDNAMKIQKTVKLDDYSYEIISHCSGRSFSDKIRNMAYEYSMLKGSVKID